MQTFNIWLERIEKTNRIEIELSIPMSLKQSSKFQEMESAYYDSIFESVSSSLHAVFKTDDYLHVRLKNRESVTIYKMDYPYSGFKVSGEKITCINPDSHFHLPLFYAYFKTCLDDVNHNILDGYFKTINFILSDNSIIMTSEISIFQSEKTYQCTTIIDSTGNVQILLPEIKNKKEWVKLIRSFLFDMLIPNL